MIRGVIVEAVAYGEEDVFPTILVRQIEEEEDQDIERIVVYYLDFDRMEITKVEEFSSTKEARSWLRKNGFNIRGIRK